MRSALLKEIGINPGANELSAQLERLELMASLIFLKRPLLFKVLQSEGRNSLFNYIYDQQQYKLADIYLERQKEIEKVLYNNITRVLGIDIKYLRPLSAQGINYVVTADHHGALGHPFFISSDILHALIDPSARPLQQHLVLNLASSSVSLNNSSYPRGLVFHARDDSGKLREQHLALLPKKTHGDCLYSNTI